MTLEKLVGETARTKSSYYHGHNYQCSINEQWVLVKFSKCEIFMGMREKINSDLEESDCALLNMYYMATLTTVVMTMCY